MEELFDDDGEDERAGLFAKEELSIPASRQSQAPGGPEGTITGEAKVLAELDRWLCLKEDWSKVAEEQDPDQEKVKESKSTHVRFYSCSVVASASWPKIERYFQ